MNELQSQEPLQLETVAAATVNFSHVCTPIPCPKFAGQRRVSLLASTVVSSRGAYSPRDSLLLRAAVDSFASWFLVGGSDSRL